MLRAWRGNGLQADNSTATATGFLDPADKSPARSSYISIQPEPSGLLAWRPERTAR
jgi:hypothetical protein